MRHPWWQAGVIYHVYPRSFKDASGDGVGDLKGITEGLDYLEWLGVDAVWLSPIYPSPMADFGYDITDHCDVDPVFGTLSDFDDLVAEAHRRELRVILDFVPNHTSDEHPWFVESRSSRENPKRDWYVWADPAPDSSPPNNWFSMFGGSAWEYDEKTSRYYLHTFDVKQPDLNWRNPEVREAMYGVMRFWLERGVDGFRIDVLPFLVKDELLRDNPPNPNWRKGDPPWARQVRIHSEDQPEVHQVIREMRKVADSYGEDRILIGEMYLPFERMAAYYGEKLDGIQLPFNFHLILLEKWNAASVRALVEGYEAALPEGAWPNWVIGNHDVPWRVAGRLGPSGARTAQMLLFTLCGTPICYYGDEIGMRDVKIPKHLARDPQGIRSPGYGRDGVRTPMQWAPGPNAGFCPPGVEPWLPLADDHQEVNVASQSEDPRSMLALFRCLVSLRRRFPALAVGSYRSLEAGDEDIFAYLREHEEQRVLVALNFGALPKRVDLSVTGGRGELLCSTRMDRGGTVYLKELKLRPDEGVVILHKGATADGHAYPEGSS